MDEHTPWQVVGVTPETKAEFEALDTVVWFDEVDPADDDPSGGVDPDRCFAATRTGVPPFAGVYGWFDQTLTVPGPDGPAAARSAGLTWVGVHPDHRRQGVLTTLLDHHLDDVHRQGYPVATLHASETTIYGRYGYAQASFGLALSVGGGTELTTPPGLDVDGLRTELVDSRDELTVARVLQVQHAVAARQVGQVTLTERHNRRRLRAHPHSLRGGEARKVLFAVRDGVDVGYAVVQRRHKWEDSLPQGTLECSEVTSDDPAARFALLRRLVSFDLIGSVTLPATSIDDEVIWWLGGPRPAKARVHDALWLRLVDVGAALALRGYAADVDTVLDVADERCPWNTGRWRLSASGGRARCERTEAAADVRLPVQALGSAYLGARPVAAMARQGVVEELTRGAVRDLSRAMHTEVAPTAALEF